MTNRNALETRIRYYQGQRLIAADLQDDYDSLSQLRGLHVVALHDTWGISLGFDVNIDPGNRSIAVGSGFAIDAYGREIVLANTELITMPLIQESESGDYELVMSYNTEAPQVTADPALCSDDSQRREKPVFQWRKTGETQLGKELPLLKVRINPMRLIPPLDLSVRRYTQPLARPHIVSGLTSSEQAWRPQTGGSGRKTWVNTYSAGFVKPPYYIATLKWDANVLADLNARGGPITVFSSIASSDAWGFWFCLNLARPFNQEFWRMSNLTIDSYPQISWMGIEPMDNCQPYIDWTKFVFRTMSILPLWAIR